MIPAEETSKSTLAARVGDPNPTPTSGQGGVAKGAGEVTVTCFPAGACGDRSREYFNKTKKTPRSARRGRGQPPRLTPGVQRTLCDLISRGMSRREAAPCLGIDHSTISRAAQRDPDFAAALRDAKRRRAVVPQTMGGGWRGDVQRKELSRMLALIPRQLVNFLPKGYF